MPKCKDLLENESIYRNPIKRILNASFFIWKDQNGNEYKVLACGIDKKTLLVYHPDGVCCNIKFNFNKEHIYPREESYQLKKLIRRC